MFLTCLDAALDGSATRWKAWRRTRRPRWPALRTCCREASRWPPVEAVSNRRIRIRFDREQILKKDRIKMTLISLEASDFSDSAATSNYGSALWSVWPDLANFWTLGNFLKPLATTNWPKSPTFLDKFCKGVKIFHFSSEIIFGQLL